MDVKEQVDEVLTLVETAQSKSKFKLEDVIKGFGFPQDTVEVYLDSESAYELSKLNDELIEESDPVEIERLEAEAAALSEKILKSKLVFHMRGIDQGQIEKIEKQSRLNQEDEDAWIMDYFTALTAANVQKVEMADGSVDESVFTIEDARSWRELMPAEAWQSLIATMQKLPLASGYFKGLTDAGFLPKS